MWDPGQGVHLFLFGFPVKPAFCKTRTGSSTHVAFVGRSVCDWHTRTVHGLEHSICSVNVTCNSDLLMFFVCVCVYVTGCVCMCVQVYGGQRASSVVICSSGTGPPSFRDQVSGFYLEFTEVLPCWLQVQARSYEPAHTTHVYTHMQMKWRSHQVAGLVHHSSCESR